MKIWQVVLLVMLLITIPVFSACDLLGIGSSKQQQQEDYYRQQLEAIQKVQEDNRKQQEEYNQRIQQGLDDWGDAYKDWLDQRQKQQLQQVEGMPSANQTTGNLTDGD